VIAASVAGLIILGALGYSLLAPEPPVAVPRETVSDNVDLSAIAARPSNKRDQSSPFSVGWRMLDPQAGDFNLVVPATTRLNKSFEGPHEGAGRMSQSGYGGTNAEAAVGVIWNSYDGVDPAYIDNAYRTRPTLDPTQDNSHLQVVGDELETFLGYPARRETLIVRFDGRVAYTEQLTCWSDRFSLSVSLGTEGETRAGWADQFFDSISVGGKSSGQPLPELTPLNGETIDLIPEIALYGTGVTGIWSRQDGHLISRGERALLVLPILPPPAWQLTIEAKRDSGSESLGIGFVVRGRQCRFGIDEYGGQRSGLSLLDGQNTLQQPATETEYGNLLGNDWNTITLTVLPRDGDFRIIGTVNDQIIVDWTGDPARLSHSNNYWRPPPDTLFLTIWEDDFRFRRIALRDLTPLVEDR
jgi:hypothetical protein